MGNIHVFVQILQRSKRSLGSSLGTDIRLSQVKVGTQVRVVDDFLVIDGNRLWSGQDEVLCGFDTNLGKLNLTPLRPWMKTLSLTSFPMASAPKTPICLE